LSICDAVFVARRRSGDGYEVERSIKVMVEPGYWHFLCPGCGRELSNPKPVVWAPPGKKECPSCRTLTNFGHFHRGQRRNLVRTEESFGKTFAFKALVSFGH